jgi:transcriptional regulator with XRE-family HTH domain
MKDCLGRRIRLVLNEKGMSQAELARMVGAKQQTIAYLVREDQPATSSRYTAQIAQALGVNLEWLADGSGERYGPTVSIAGGASVSKVPVLSTEQVEAFAEDHPEASELLTSISAGISARMDSLS